MQIYHMVDTSRNYYYILIPKRTIDLIQIKSVTTRVDAENRKFAPVHLDFTTAPNKSHNFPLLSQQKKACTLCGKNCKEKQITWKRNLWLGQEKNFQYFGAVWSWVVSYVNCLNFAHCFFRFEQRPSSKIYSHSNPIKRAATKSEFGVNFDRFEIKHFLKINHRDCSQSLDIWVWIQNQGLC